MCQKGMLAAGILGCAVSRSPDAYQEAAAGVRRDDLAGAERWLCPALFKYFAEAPEHLYLQIKASRA